MEIGYFGTCSLYMLVSGCSTYPCYLEPNLSSSFIVQFIMIIHRNYSILLLTTEEKLTVTCWQSTINQTCHWKICLGCSSNQRQNQEIKCKFWAGLNNWPSFSTLMVTRGDKNVTSCKNDQITSKRPSDQNPTFHCANLLQNERGNFGLYAGNPKSSWPEPLSNLTNQNCGYILSKLEHIKWNLID